MHPPESSTRRLFSIAEAVRVSGISRSSLYAALASGRLQARKLGRKTVIPASELEQFIENLPPAVFGAARGA